MSSPTILAYLAGIFDGEGCIGFYKSGSVGGRYFRLTVAMTDEAIIRLLHTELGGRMNGPKKPQKAHWKPLYVWNARGEDAWRAYYLMEPYLRLKRWSREPK